MTTAAPAASAKNATPNSNDIRKEIKKLQATLNGLVDKVASLEKVVGEFPAPAAPPGGGPAPTPQSIAEILLEIEKTAADVLAKVSSSTPTRPTGTPRDEIKKIIDAAIALIESDRKRAATILDSLTPADDDFPTLDDIVRKLRTALALFGQFAADLPGKPDSALEAFKTDVEAKREAALALFPDPDRP